MKFSEHSEVNTIILQHTRTRPQRLSDGYLFVPSKRATGGRDPGVHIRLPETMLSAIDARSVEDGTNRSEAIRRLVEIGLKAKK